jgi:hypothetical protein
MIANIPVPQADQTIESLAALVWMRNGWPSWRLAVEALFGRPNVELGRCRHVGLIPFFSRLTGGVAGISVEQHSYLSIFKPFMAREQYRRIIAAMEGNKRLGPLCRRPADIVREHAVYCSSCIQQELSNLGFAYTHRVHQVVGVRVCHRHDEPLRRLIAPKDSLAALGILCNSEAESPSWHPESPDATNEITQGMRRYAQFVAASLRGDMPHASVQDRLSAIADRLGMAKNSYFPDYPALVRLSRTLKEQFGRSFLEDLGVAYLTDVTEHLPRILLGKKAYTEDPLANLVVLAALFESPPEYVSAIGQPCADSSGRRIKLPVDLVKDFVAGTNVRSMARTYRLSATEIHSCLVRFPEIERRRANILKREAAARQLLKTAARKSHAHSQQQVCNEDLALSACS